MNDIATSKTALVTGGTSGIGLSIARALVEEGAQVTLVGSNPTKGARAAAELNALGVGHASFVAVDLSRLDEAQVFAARYATEVGVLDVLVQVAGVVLSSRQVTDDGFEKTLAVDHLSAFVLARALRPALARAPRGRIVNVSAGRRQMLSARLSFDNLQLERGYNLVKAVAQALHAKTVMTQVLAEQFVEDGIDVMAFDAGAVKSNMADNLSFPWNVMMRAVQMFMPTVSKTGVYAATSPDLIGVTGVFVDKRGHTPLAFEADYAARAFDVTEELVERAAAVVPSLQSCDGAVDETTGWREEPSQFGSV